MLSEPETPREGASSPPAGAHGAGAGHHDLAAVLALPGRAASRWHRAGLGARAERLFNVIAGTVLGLLTAGWLWSIIFYRAQEAEGATLDGRGVTPVTAAVGAALTNGDAPTTAYLTDAALRAFLPLRGASGKLRATIEREGGEVVDTTLPPGTEITYRAGAHAETTATAQAPRSSGVWQITMAIGDAIRPLTDFSVITMVPFSAKQRGRIGAYLIGSWPGERSRRVRAGYENPEGFIEVTPQNADTHVSEHFRLRDFLTHGQENVWPKYLVLRLKLVDKLELVLSDLSQRGIDVSGVHVMSGFRTPTYNVSGGDPSGRAALSRHMYGDASDIFIDDDHDGRMDDLNHDGRVDIDDARVIQAAVDRVERAHPELVGGAGVYPAEGGHGPFIHIDTRGYRARWIGSGGG